jgi:hypothetical protein
MIKKHLLPIALIIFVGVFLISSIFHAGWYATHDGIFHIYRTEEALSMLKLGQFPLRWAGNFDQGFGIPLFTFIYPLPYYLTSVISYVIGSIWAIKILTIIAYLSGGLGIYQLFKKSGDQLAVTLSLIYLMTPYIFLNIFVRGALGEILALGLMPWVLCSFNSLLDRDAVLKWYHPIPLALLLVAHNFLGILFIVFLIGYLIFDKNQKSLAFKNLFLSLGLASFFLIPMIGEKNMLYSYLHPDLNFRFDQHFVYFRQLLYSKWDYWYSMPGLEDGMSFQLGFVQIMLALSGSIYTIFNKKRTKLQLYLIVAYFGSIFLMISRSYPIWHWVPLLQSIQFPWRFLFMPTILTPLLAYPLLLSLSKKKFFPYLLICLLALNFANVRNYRRPMKFFNLTEYTDLYRLYYNKTSTTFRTEILPKWGVPGERYKSEELLVNAGNMTIDALVTSPLSVTTTIHNKPDESIGRITILRNYYPGWIATMDGKTQVELKSTDEGMISMEPVLGIHNYVIRISSTPLEKAANFISLASFIGLGYLWQKNRKKTQ